MKKVIQAERLSNCSGPRVNQGQAGTPTHVRLTRKLGSPLGCCVPLLPTRGCLSPAESDGELPAGHQDAQVQHLHRLEVCGHDVVFADDLKHRSTGRWSQPLRSCLEEGPARSRGNAGLTQQSARWSWSSASRRPTHILFPTPNGRWAKGLTFFLS